MHITVELLMFVVTTLGPAFYAQNRKGLNGPGRVIYDYFLMRILVVRRTKNTLKTRWVGMFDYKFIPFT